jgi:hypothetical protein
MKTKIDDLVNNVGEEKYFAIIYIDDFSTYSNIYIKEIEASAKAYNQTSGCYICSHQKH